MNFKQILTFVTTISLSFVLSACGGNTQSDAKSVEVAAPKTMAATPEFQKIDTVVGEGAAVAVGQQVSVHYTGWLYDVTAENNRGTKFDSSVDRGRPFEFPLGAGRVIKGWDEGVAGMQVGGKRTLIIPAAMGYGARGAGKLIPPNATLLFDVELLEIK